VPPVGRLRLACRRTRVPFDSVITGYATSGIGTLLMDLHLPERSAFRGSAAIR
jgi:hypothetical protein